MQMYGPRQWSRILPSARCQIFFEALFICNNINTNLNKNFEKIRKRKMAQGRVPSPASVSFFYFYFISGLVSNYRRGRRTGSL